MNTWSFYDPNSGIVSGAVYRGRAADLQLNTPPGLLAFPGFLDHLSQRIDLHTGQPVDHQPPAPADDKWQTWDWDGTARRWVSSPTLAALQRDRTTEIDLRMQAAESDQARPLRELQVATATGQPAPVAALQRLQDVEARIVALRTLRAQVLAAQSVSDLPALP